jgi:hypothetical protein
MKQFIIIFLAGLLSLKAFSQDENSIKLQSEATFILTKTTTGRYDCKLAEIKKFDNGPDESGDQLFKGKVDSNQVKLFFFRGKFGSAPATLLIIKSGLSVPLEYHARIKREGRDEFRTTDVMPLYPNLKSVEEWPDNLDEIILDNFTASNNKM